MNLHSTFELKSIVMSIGFVLLSLSEIFSQEVDPARIEIFRSENPAAVVVRFNSIEIKRLEKDYLEHRSRTLEDMALKEKRSYDPIIENLKMVTGSRPKGQLYHSGVDNGLLGAMFSAYSDHIPLVIRPDDVWLTISANLSHYVAQNADRLRERFVKHDGQEKLVVKMVGKLHGQDEVFWARFVDLMMEQMRPHLTEDVTDWLVPNFSTTTKKDRLVGQMLIMGAMNKFFNYHGIFSCGLPKLTLLGSLGDWMQLKSKVEQLATIDEQTKTWSEVLLPIVDQFIETYQGRVDETFWQRMVTYLPLGSGGQKRLRGWFIALAPFNEKGKYILNSKEEIEQTGIYATILDDEIYQSMVSVPVTLDDNGVHHDLVFWGGVSASVYDSYSNNVRASVDWAILDKTKKTDGELWRSIAENFYYRDGYEKIDEKYRSLLTHDQYNLARSILNNERDSRIAEYEEERRKMRDQILSLPADQRVQAILEKYPWTKWEDLHGELKAAVDQAEYELQYNLKLEAYEKKRSEEEAAYVAEARQRHLAWLDLSRFDLLEKIVVEFYSYDSMPKELQAVVTETEFAAAREFHRRLFENEEYRWR